MSVGRYCPPLLGDQQDADWPPPLSAYASMPPENALAGVLGVPALCSLSVQRSSGPCAASRDQIRTLPGKWRTPSGLPIATTLRVLSSVSLTSTTLSGRGSSTPTISPDGGCFRCTLTKRWPAYNGQCFSKWTCSAVSRTPAPSSCSRRFWASSRLQSTCVLFTTCRHVYWDSGGRSPVGRASLCGSRLLKITMREPVHGTVPSA